MRRTAYPLDGGESPGLGQKNTPSGFPGLGTEARRDAPGVGIGVPKKPGDAAPRTTTFRYRRQSTRRMPEVSLSKNSSKRSDKPPPRAL